MFIVLFFQLLIFPGGLIAQEVKPMKGADAVVAGYVRHQQILPAKNGSGATWFRFDFSIRYVSGINISKEKIRNSLWPGDSLYSLEYCVQTPSDSLRDNLFCTVYLTADSTSSCGWKLTSPLITGALLDSAASIMRACNTVYSSDNSSSGNYRILIQTRKWHITELYTGGDTLVMKIKVDAEQKIRIGVAITRMPTVGNRG